MKKVVSAFLALALCFSVLSVPAWAAEGNDVIMPCHTNITVAQVTLAINDTGLATVNNYCTGIPGTTWIRAQTYLEKKVNGVWKRVDILATDDQWVTSINSRIFSVDRTHQLTSRGNYRAVTTFTVTAGSAESVTVVSEATY